MATVFIALSIDSIVGSVRRNPFIDDPIQLITESGVLIRTENDFELAITIADYNVRDRLGALITDRAGSTIALRGG